jgi:hypothetical protein
MARVRFLVEFTSLVDDDDFVLDRLTRELAVDLAEIGDVNYESAQSPPDSKGAEEIVLGALSVLTAAEPSHVQAVVDTVVAFLGRNTGRRAHLKVADVELAIDRPTKGEVADMIKIVRTAIERSRH